MNQMLLTEENESIIDESLIEEPRLQRARSFRIGGEQTQQFQSNIIINTTSQNVMWMPPQYLNPQMQQIYNQQMQNLINQANPTQQQLQQQYQQQQPFMNPQHRQINSEQMFTHSQFSPNLNISLYNNNMMSDGQLQNNPLQQQQHTSHPQYTQQQLQQFQDMQNQQIQYSNSPPKMRPFQTVAGNSLRKSMTMQNFDGIINQGTTNTEQSDYEDPTGYFNYVPPAQDWTQMNQPLLGVQQRKSKPAINQNQKRQRNLKQRLFKIFLKEQDNLTKQSDSESQNSQQLQNTPQALLKKAQEQHQQKEKERDKEGSMKSSEGSSGFKLGMKKVNSYQEMSYLSIPGQIQSQQQVNQNLSSGNIIDTNSNLSNNLATLSAVPVKTLKSQNDDKAKKDTIHDLLSKSVIEGDDGEDDMFQFDDGEEEKKKYQDDDNKNDSLEGKPLYMGRQNQYKFGDKQLIGNDNKFLGQSENNLFDDLSFQSEIAMDYTKELGDLNLKTIKYKRLKKKRCNPIFPDSNFKTGWDLTGLFLILYEAILIPYRVAFNIPSSGWFSMFEYSIDLFFLTDILINMYTGYYKKGFLVMRRRHVMWRYLKTWFFLDLIASFPYAWFISEATNQNLDELEEEYADEDWQSRGTNQTVSLLPQTAQLLRLLKIIRFLRIIRLIRLFKLRRLVYRFEEFFFNDKISTFMEVLKIFLVLFFLVHWTGCIFFFIGDIERRMDIEPNWVEKFKLDKGKDPIHLYVIATSWALTTMTTVGYGDVYPVSPVEQVFATVCMIVACGFFAYLVGSIFAIIDKTATLITDFQDKMISINDFMIHNHIPRDFRTKDNKKEFKLEEEDVLDMLNENLRLEMIVHLNGKMLHSTSIFKSFNIAFISELTFVLKRETFTIDENIFIVNSLQQYHVIQEGDIGDSLYYMCSGNVSLIHKRTLSFIKDLGGDDFFGECAFFSQKLRKATIRSKNFTEVIKLVRSDFMEQADQFPRVIQTFEMIKQEINQYNDYTSIGVTCYICEEKGHIATDCKDFSIIKGSLKALAKKKFFIAPEPINKSADAISQSQKLIEARKFGSIRFKEDYFDKQMSQSLAHSGSGSNPLGTVSGSLSDSQSFARISIALGGNNGGGSNESPDERVRSSISQRPSARQSMVRLTEHDEKDFFKRLLLETELERAAMSSREPKDRKLNRSRRKDYANKEDIEEIKEENDEDESFRSTMIKKLKRKNQRQSIRMSKPQVKKTYREPIDTSDKESQSRESDHRKHSVTSFRDLLNKDSGGTWNQKTMKAQDQMDLLEFIKLARKSEIKLSPEQFLRKQRSLQNSNKSRNTSRHTKGVNELTRQTNEDRAFLIRRRRRSINEDEEEDSLIRVGERRTTKKSLIRRKRVDKFNISEKFFEGINIDKKPGGNFRDLMSNSIKFQKREAPSHRTHVVRNSKQSNAVIKKKDQTERMTLRLPEDAQDPKQLNEEDIMLESVEDLIHKIRFEEDRYGGAQSPAYRKQNSKRGRRQRD